MSESFDVSSGCRYKKTKTLNIIKVSKSWRVMHFMFINKITLEHLGKDKRAAWTHNGRRIDIDIEYFT